MGRADRARARGAQIVLLGNGDEQTEKRNTLGGEQRSAVNRYRTHGGVENLVGLLHYLAHEFAGKEVEVPPVLERPLSGFFHLGGRLFETLEEYEALWLDAMRRMMVRSFQRLVLVLVVGPLGLIGVVAVLLPSGRPLGFVAILGILALLGMITKNAVILLDQIDSERGRGKSVREAVIDASSSRFRPILLTAISTVLGMIPIAPTVFWGPMAFAIMGGLFVATLLTLVFLPTLYVTIMGGREPDRAYAAAA